MTFFLKSTERARIERMVQTPKNSKQLRQATALLALDRGESSLDVTEQYQIRPERLDSWVRGFHRMRLGFLAEPRNNQGRRSRDVFKRIPNATV